MRTFLLAAFAVALAFTSARADDPRTALDGRLTQGGLVFGTTTPGAHVTLDGKAVEVSEGGRFLLGFGRDQGPGATLAIVYPDGSSETRALSISSRAFPTERINGLDSSKVDTYTEEQLAKIRADSAKKKAARETSETKPEWAAGFTWPATGRVSGVFGSQRILNGVPKTPHSGVDVAVPTGTPVRAPAPGIVRLAEPDMYFEGGLILLDHGQHLETAVMHLSKLAVKAGDHVEKGQVIAYSGATGRATGPHLHWSLKWNGLLVDPQLLAGAMPARETAGGE